LLFLALIKANRKYQLVQNIRSSGLSDN